MSDTEYSERTHITISVPRELIDEVKDIISNLEYKGGYRTHSEFCIGAIRRRLEQVKEKMEFGKRD